MRTAPATREAIKLWHEGQMSLAEIEHNGIRIDEAYLDSQLTEVGAAIREHERVLRSDKVYSEWRKAFGDRTKLGSKEQLAKVIFDRMKFPRKTVAVSRHKDDEGGKRESKWDEASFSEVDLPFIKEYFACEKLKKLRSTYLEGIKREVVGGFVHPSYNLHLMLTLRSSSDTPNFQNVPNRNKKIADIIRRCYIPRKGRQLVEIDYGGIEVRIMCCYSHDPQLIKEFTGPDGDPHGDTARELYFLKGWKPQGEEQKAAFKKGMRDWAKNRMVFPSFYGSVYFQTAPALWQPVETGAMMPDGSMTIREHMRKHGVRELGDCSPVAVTSPGTFIHHVKHIEESFWGSRFKGHDAWRQSSYAKYLKRGWLDMHTGFRVSGLFNRNQIINFPVQGAAFHCELWSLIRLIKRLKKYKMQSLLVGEIHDCDIGDVVPSELQDYLNIAREIKEVELLKAMPWIVVPMPTEMEVCGVDAPWGSKRVWVKQGDEWALPQAN